MFRRKEEETTSTENEQPAAAQPTHYAPAPAQPAANTFAQAAPVVAAPAPRPASVAEAKVAPLPQQQNPSPYRPTATPATAPVRPSAPAATQHDEKAKRRILTVGNDILLKGEIATCDRLVIEGAVDAKLNDVHTVEIAQQGSLRGFAEIEDAEISGLFEGDLVVRNRLVIYSTGKVRGKISYGEIEIERGGELSGEIKMVGQGVVQSSKKDGKTKAA